MNNYYEEISYCSSWFPLRTDNIARFRTIAQLRVYCWGKGGFWNTYSDHIMTSWGLAITSDHGERHIYIYIIFIPITQHDRPAFTGRESSSSASPDGVPRLFSQPGHLVAPDKCNGVDVHGGGCYDRWKHQGVGRGQGCFRRRRRRRKRGAVLGGEGEGEWDGARGVVNVQWVTLCHTTILCCELGQARLYGIGW